MGEFKSALDWMGLLIAILGFAFPLIGVESLQEGAQGLIPLFGLVVGALLLAKRERIEKNEGALTQAVTAQGSQKESAWSVALSRVLLWSEKAFNGVLIAVTVVFVGLMILGVWSASGDENAPDSLDCGTVLAIADGELLRNGNVAGFVTSRLDESTILETIGTKDNDFQFDAENLRCLGEREVPPRVLHAMLAASLKDEAAEPKVDEEPIQVAEVTPPKPRPRKQPAPKPPPEPAPQPEPRAAPVLLPASTPILLRIDEELHSKTAEVGEPLTFTVVEAVVVDGTRVIAEGAQARGNVKVAKKGRTFGRKGKLEFSIDVVEAIDGQQVPLRLHQRLEGNDRDGATAIATEMGGALGGLVKGKNVVLPAGTEMTVFTQGDQQLRIRR